MLFYVEIQCTVGLRGNRPKINKYIRKFFIFLHQRPTKHLLAFDLIQTGRLQNDLYINWWDVELLWSGLDGPSEHKQLLTKDQKLDVRSEPTGQEF